MEKSCLDMAKKDYKDRFYRSWTEPKGFIREDVIVGETDISIYAAKKVREIAEKLVRKYRSDIEDYIKKEPLFKTSLTPILFDYSAPDIIKDMITTSTLAGVGPMASVAGAIAEFVGRQLLICSNQVIVENGGDIFITSDIERRIGIFAGDSPLTRMLFIKLKPQDMPCGVCTSSGTVGHSLSFGKADACVIISSSTSLADAVATAVCNRVKRREDIDIALQFAISIEMVKGALIIYGKDFGVAGDIELA